MSRSSNRGPRADIALLRKLKADPNFSPSSLLNAGPNFLEKANKLKGFVAEQRGKLGATAAKTEWLLAYQQFQGDLDDAERELSSCLQQLAEQHSAADLRQEAAEALSQLHSQADACRVERAALRSQVKGLSSVHASLKAYGTPPQFSKEAEVLKGEMSVLGREVDSALAALAGEAATLTSELRDLWPSALPASPAGLGAAAAGAAVAAGAGSGAEAASGADAGSGSGGGDLVPLPGPGEPGAGAAGNRAEEAEELERMMARYPYALPDIKERIREVFVALQDKYQERLETWRLETERIAAKLMTLANTTNTSTNSSSSGHNASSSTQPPRAGAPRQQQQQQQSPQQRDPSGSTEWALTACGYPSNGSPNDGSGCGGGGTAGSASVAISWLLNGYGGWSAEEHSAFVRHRDRLLKEGGQGGKPLSRDALLARIARLLPGSRSPACMRLHEEWAAAARQAGRRRRDLTEGWERERRQFVEDSSSFLQESETTFWVQAESAADRLVAELVRERARDDLQELRAERAREEEVAAAERAAQQAAEAEAAAAAEARERQDRAVKRDMIAAYRTEIERQQVEAEAAAAEAEQQAAREAEVAAVYNKERVEVRHAEYLERQEQAKERQEAAAAAAAAREARLARLAALVAPEVAADPARLMAPTAATSAALSLLGERSEGAFHPVNGYTTDQVVRDQRFKVREALAQLGLHETEYGRRAIAAARPAGVTRPDNFTTEQRDAIGR